MQKIDKDIMEILHINPKIREKMQEIQNDAQTVIRLMRKANDELTYQDCMNTYLLFKLAEIVSNEVDEI
jgi:hypothetical protein